MDDERIGRLMASLDYPMYVVTARSGDERSGCLVGFGTQCSIHPPRWLICLSNKNRTYRVAARAQSLVVHLLRADQHGVAELFGGETDDEVDKFARCAWVEGPGGAPVLHGCDWIGGPIINRIELGDHAGHLIEVTDGGTQHGGDGQLGFHAVRDISPGHAP
ncbi:MAG: flavin reductase family protein [Candidatus Velthaea sp.]